MQRVWFRPMSVGYINLVRYDVKLAIIEAMNQHRDFTPLYWTGSHLTPISFGVIKGGKKTWP